MSNRLVSHPDPNVTNHLYLLTQLSLAIVLIRNTPSNLSPGEYARNVCCQYRQALNEWRIIMPSTLKYKKLSPPSPDAKISIHLNLPSTGNSITKLISNIQYLKINLDSLITQLESSSYSPKFNAMDNFSSNSNIQFDKDASKLVTLFDRICQDFIIEFDPKSLSTTQYSIFHLFSYFEEILPKIFSLTSPQIISIELLLNSFNPFIVTILKCIINNVDYEIVNSINKFISPLLRRDEIFCLIISQSILLVCEFISALCDYHLKGIDSIFHSNYISSITNIILLLENSFTDMNTIPEIKPEVINKLQESAKSIYDLNLYPLVFFKLHFIIQQLGLTMSDNNQQNIN